MTRSVCSKGLHFHVHVRTIALTVLVVVVGLQVLIIAVGISMAASTANRTETDDSTMHLMSMLPPSVSRSLQIMTDLAASAASSLHATAIGGGGGNLLHVSQAQPHPRVIMSEPLLNETLGINVTAKHTSLLAKKRKLNENNLEMIPAEIADYDYGQIVTDDEITGCPMIADWQWQTVAKPTCNSLHEFGMRMNQEGPIYSFASPGGKGSWKQIWTTSEDDSIVLKTNKNTEGRDQDGQYADTKDALVMEQTTFSPYITNIYGWCRQSSIVEKATGSLENWVSNARKNMTSHELLELSIMVSQAASDVHLFHKGVPTVVHSDMKLAQFFYTLDKKTQRPIVKLNDFNLAKFLTAKPSANNPTTSSDICPRISRGGHFTTFRSPEEYTKGAEMTEKIDIVALGSMLYWLLAGSDPFLRDENGSEIPLPKAKQKIRDGEIPPLPKKITNSSDPKIKAVVSAMIDCRKVNPQGRPSAKQVVEFLKVALFE